MTMIICLCSTIISFAQPDKNVVARLNIEYNTTGSIPIKYYLTQEEKLDFYNQVVANRTFCFQHALLIIVIALLVIIFAVTILLKAKSLLVIINTMLSTLCITIALTIILLNAYTMQKDYKTLNDYTTKSDNIKFHLDANKEELTRLYNLGVSNEI